MKTLKDYEFWFVVGSQFLYGPEVLDTVAKRAEEMVARMNATKLLPCRIVYKTTVKTPEEATEAVKAAHPEVELWLGTFNTNRRSYMAQMIGAEGMKDAIKGLGFQWEGLDCAESLCAEFKLPFICCEAECGNGRMDWNAGERIAVIDAVDPEVI